MAVSVAQADQLSDVMAKTPLSCGVHADVPPFSAPEPHSRELVGMDVDLYQAQTQCVALELKPLSVAVRIPEVKMSGIDLISANLAYTKIRAERIPVQRPTLHRKGNPGGACGQCRQAEVFLQRQARQLHQALDV